MTMSEQLPLFGGVTYDPELDGERLGKQLTKVRELMLDGEWRTLRQCSDFTGAPEASISARLRDLRKPRFGEYVVERRRRGEAERGLWEYRVLPPAEVEA
jgi:hypothetical protein